MLIGFIRVFHVVAMLIALLGALITDETGLPLLAAAALSFAWVWCENEYRNEERGDD